MNQAGPFTKAILNVGKENTCSFFYTVPSAICPVQIKPKG